MAMVEATALSQAIQANIASSLVTAHREAAMEANIAASLATAVAMAANIAKDMVAKVNRATVATANNRPTNNLCIAAMANRAMVAMLAKVTASRPVMEATVAMANNRSTANLWAMVVMANNKAMVVMANNRAMVEATDNNKVTVIKFNLKSRSRNKPKVSVKRAAPLTSAALVLTNPSVEALVIALAVALAKAKALASAVATSVASASLQALTLAVASALPTPSPPLTLVASVAVAASVMTLATAPTKQLQLCTPRHLLLLRNSIMSTSTSQLAVKKPAELLWSCMVTLLRLPKTSEHSALARRERLAMVITSATRAASSTVSSTASWPKVVTSPEETAPVASASMEMEKSLLMRTSTTGIWPAVTFPWPTLALTQTVLSSS